MIEVKEHGIYERRDGAIVGPAKRSGGIDFPWAVGDRSYTPVGSYTVHRPDTSIDLIRGIVVGPGWRPWNGGENPAPGEVIEYVTRGGVYSGQNADEASWIWEPHNGREDILAYRIIEEAETAKEGEGRAEPTADTIREMTARIADLEGENARLRQYWNLLADVAVATIQSIRLP